LGIGVEIDGDLLSATIPTFRQDLEREADLIEEIGRIHGYDRLPSTPPRAVLRVGRKEPLESWKDGLRELLVGLGLSEVVVDGFDKEGWRTTVGLSDEDLVEVRNPMTEAQRALRGQLVPGILSVVETNLNQRVVGGMIFEIGRVFSRSSGERDALGGALFGRTGLELRGKEQVDLGLAKGILSAMFSALGAERMEVSTTSLPPFLAPGRAGRVFASGEELGWFGELAPAIRSRLAASVEIVVFEFDLETLWRLHPGARTFVPLPRFPASLRDLSLHAPVDLAEDEIREAIRAEKEVEHVLLYDLYEGEQVASGRKSLTYEVSLRASDHTLTDEEAAAIVGRIEARLAELDVHLRA
jgi:phenylalanyl-tRNA synthetase beta chain